MQYCKSCRRFPYSSSSNKSKYRVPLIAQNFIYFIFNSSSVDVVSWSIRKITKQFTLNFKSA
jgi:hypothetical protein